VKQAIQKTIQSCDHVMQSVGFVPSLESFKVHEMILVPDQEYLYEANVKGMQSPIECRFHPFDKTSVDSDDSLSGVQVLISHFNKKVSPYNYDLKPTNNKFFLVYAIDEDHDTTASQCIHHTFHYDHIYIRVTSKYECRVKF
jgi:hypothetical protein